jgi:hypothetical protein
MSNPENTGAVRADYLTRFQPGNPGKPKGVKHKLQEDFLKDVQASWEQKGKQAIDDMIADKPGDFVKMVASLMPKEATLNINDNSEMTDDELAQRVRDLAAQLSPFLLDGTGTVTAGSGDKAGAQEPSIVH